MKGSGEIKLRDGLNVQCSEHKLQTAREAKYFSLSLAGYEMSVIKGQGIDNS